MINKSILTTKHFLSQNEVCTGLLSMRKHAKKTAKIVIGITECHLQHLLQQVDIVEMKKSNYKSQTTLVITNTNVPTLKTRTAKWKSVTKKCGIN